MNKIKHYDGYLTFAPLCAAEIEAVRELFNDVHLEVKLYEDSIEFSFVGRDLADSVVRVFSALALILKDSDGELRCEIDEEKIDPRFRFFSISNSKLWQQSGEIIRGKVTEVSL